MNIAEFLDRSQATEAFKADVLAFASHEPSDRVQLTKPAPRVKVLRLVAQLLTQEPELPIDRIAVEGVSGCSDFRGTARVGVGAEERRYEFAWDCQWRAQQEGWEDCFGFPDQIRAAQTFGWDCFMTWRRADDVATARAGALAGRA